jgi:PAS domain-containing protein
VPENKKTIKNVQKYPKKIKNPKAMTSKIALDKSSYNEKIRAEIALNSISDAVICTDMNGLINYLNTAAINITGWSKKEAYGLPCNQVFKIINCSTRENLP